MSAQDLAFGHATPHYGLRIIEVGEDGGTLVVEGHHDDRRTLASINRYARKVWGEPALSSPFLDRIDLQRVKAVVTHACHRGWLAEDDLPLSEMERPDQDGGCQDCLDEADSTWAMHYGTAAQTEPDAFPVTVWEYDQ